MNLELSLDTTGFREHTDKQAGILEAVLEAKANEFVQRLHDLIDLNLTGEVLREKTGNLAGSVMQQAAAWVGSVCQASVGIPDDAPAFKYGIVHELGGLGYYQIFPKDKLALAFELGEAGGGSDPWGGMFGQDGAGMMIFAGQVNHPPAKKRPFIHPAVEELRQTFYDDLHQTVTDVLGA